MTTSLPPLLEWAHKQRRAYRTKTDNLAHAHTSASPSQDPATIGDVGALLFTGVLCADGAPTLEPSSQALRCDANSTEPPIVVEHTAPIARAGIAPNLNPAIADAWLSFAAAAWPASVVAPPSIGCAAVAGGPQPPPRAHDTLAPGISINAPQEARELHGNGEREKLIFGRYATHRDPPDSTA